MSLSLAVADFCHTIGLPAAPLPLALRFERSGALLLEEHGETLHASLFRRFPAHRKGVAVAALRAVGPDQRLPYAIRAGFRGEETLVFLAKVPATTVDPVLLEHLITTLVSLADDVDNQTS